MKSISRFTVPILMLFGPGSLSRLGKLARQCGISRPFIVTDPGIVACGILDQVLEALGDSSSKTIGSSATVFDAVKPNPHEKDVLSCRDIYNQSGADGILAVGGGSAIDHAKGIRLMATHEGSLKDYDLLKGGVAKIVNDVPPLVAVPTTAGTGSEVSRGALIVTQEGDVVRKTVVAGPRLVPSAAILDANLTIGLPPALTAGTGIDALTHCIEEYISPQYHPVIAAVSLDGAEIISRALPRVWKDPLDVEARGDMLMASMMGGVGFEKGLGAIHSLAHAIGAVHSDLHHGMLNAIMLPSGMEFNRKHCHPGILESLAKRVGLPATSDNDAADRLIDWLRQLNSEMNIPERLRDLKDFAADQQEIIARALDDHCHRTSPRPCKEEDFMELWEMTY